MKKNGFIFELAAIAAMVSILPLSASANSNYPFSAFWDDAEISLRNASKHEGQYRWNPDTEAMDYKYQTASVFTARLNSGYVGRGKVKMGFDVGALGTVNLGDSDWNQDFYNGEKMLAQEECVTNENGILKCEPKGYMRMSVASAKVRLGKGWNDQTNIEMGLGHYQGGLIKTNDPDESIVPNSYRGASLIGRKYGFEYSAVWVDRFIRNGLDRLSPIKIYDNDAKEEPVFVEVPFVYGFGLTRRDKNYAVSFATGISKDYLSRYTLFGKRMIRMGGGHNIEFTSAFQLLKYSGSVWDEAVQKGIHDEGMDQSRLLDVTARYFNNNWSFTLGHATTTGTTNFNYGFNGMDGVIYDSGKAEIMSYFRKPGDKQYSLKSAYTFRSDDNPEWLNGLTPYYNLHYFVRPEAEQKENWQITGYERGTGFEHVVGLKYRPQFSALKGAEFKIFGAFYRPDEALAAMQDDDPKDRYDVSEIVVEAKFPIF